MNFVVEHSGRFVSYCFDTIDAVAADSMTAATISWLEFPGPMTTPRAITLSLVNHPKSLVTKQFTSPFLELKETR